MPDKFTTSILKYCIQIIYNYISCQSNFPRLSKNEVFGYCIDDIIWALFTKHIQYKKGKNISIWYTWLKPHSIQFLNP